MVSFSHGGTLGYYLPVGAWDRLAEVGFQLAASHAPVSVDGVYFSIIVEQNREVVYVSFHADVFPRTFYVVGNVYLQSLTVDVSEDVEFPVVISYAGCPDPLSVDLLPFGEREGGVVEVEAVEAVGYLFPVDEVA